MSLPDHKTKIVCTIGPASRSPEILRQLIEHGLNVARLNFAHGDFADHRQVIETIRAAARAAGRRVAILADLPGPKMRIGTLPGGRVELERGQAFTLVAGECEGNAKRVSASFAGLPRAVRPGDTVFLSDGLIQLEVVQVEGAEVRCRVLVGGPLLSHKGINLPGIDLGIGAFTERDRECLEFALGQGVDAVSQSFVQGPEDIQAVRAAAAALGHAPFVIAKIERSRALERIGAILDAADGMMVARGDLGVEIPIERIAVVQKDLIREAVLRGKPVITATQMLESMVGNRRPTRAEATDVANAILDGTDCVMVSEESAMGAYPLEAVSMLTRIAAATEPHRRRQAIREAIANVKDWSGISIEDLIAVSVHDTAERLAPAAVVTPTETGTSARSIARFRLPVWIAAVSRHDATCQRLQFSYGVAPVHEPEEPADWPEYIRGWLARNGLDQTRVVLTRSPHGGHPGGTNRMEIIDLVRLGAAAGT